MAVTHAPSRLLLLATWLFVPLPVLVMAQFLPAGWDDYYYVSACAELHTGRSPYLSGIARLHGKTTPGRIVSYIYPPATLTLLRPFAALPPSWQAACYWLLYAAGTFGLLRVQLGLLAPRERPLCGLLAPFCIFFPALLYDNSVLGGNVAAVLYGLAACGFARGWRTGRWVSFQLSILLASLFKPPLLTLLVLPPLAAPGSRPRRLGFTQSWWSAAAAGALGCMLYALQSTVWPLLFVQYSQLMRLELELNREFGFTPAGLLADHLQRAHLPWQAAWTACYLFCALPVAYLLFRGSRLFAAGRIPAQSWLPVLLLGTVLLSPRLMAYDAAAITFPMLLLAFRCLRASTGISRRAALTGLGLFLLFNLLVALLEDWNLIASCLLFALFLLGSRLLVQQAELAVAQ